LVLGEEFLQRLLGFAFLRQNTLGGHFPDVGGGWYCSRILRGHLLLGLNIASLFFQFDDGFQTFVIVLLMNLL
jgi:hypothetical protein